MVRCIPLFPFQACLSFHAFIGCFWVRIQNCILYSKTSIPILYRNGIFDTIDTVLGATFLRETETVRNAFQVLPERFTREDLQRTTLVQ